MTKVLKILAKILGGFLEWGLILIIVFAFAIRTSPVQTYLAEKATKYLSEELHTVISIDQLDVVFINRLRLKGFYIQDLQKDTLAYINDLNVKINGINDFKKGVKIKEVALYGGAVYLNREKDSGEYNFQFIKDYFKPKKTSKKKSPIELAISGVKLEGIHFKYDDFRKSPLKEGMDYNHLDLREIHLSAKNFKSKNDVLSAVIEKLSATEKSGFILDDFKGLATVSSNGVHVNQVEITTPQSKIYSSKFHLNYTGYIDFMSFVDSVDFDAVLDSSSVNLKDIAYFAPQLMGMEQKVLLSGLIKNKIKNLKVEKLDLKTGANTHLKGTIHLPDFRSLDNAFYQERIHYAYVDLNDIQQIKMPNSVAKDYIKLDPHLERFGFVKGEDVRLDVFGNQFFIRADKLATDIGVAYMNNGIGFKVNEHDHLVEFRRTDGSDYDVKIESFDLGEFLDNSNFGEVDGTFFLSGEASSWNDIRFSEIEGIINRFDLAGYAYQNIEVKEGTLIDEVFRAKVDIKDDNLQLAYDGTIDFKDEPILDLAVDIKEALLERLGFTDVRGTKLNSKFKVNLVGVDPNKTRGQVVMEGFIYEEAGRKIEVPELVLSVNRGEQDRFIITSKLLDAELNGKITFDKIGQTFGDQFAKVFPSLYAMNKVKNKEQELSKDKFTYSVTTKNFQPFLDIFVPDLKIKPGTKLNGDFDGLAEVFNLNINSGQIIYQGKIFDHIVATQSLKDGLLQADYKVSTVQLNDSIFLNEVHFTTNGANNLLNSTLTWNPDTDNATDIRWLTSFDSPTNMTFELEPSYLSVNKMRWDIAHAASVALDSTDLLVKDFKLSRNRQYIEIAGHVSKDDNEYLRFDFNEIDLNEWGKLLGLSKKLEGELNGWGQVSNPYTNINYLGDATIEGLKINDEEVGNVFVQSSWDKSKETMELMGNLEYKGLQTFDFEGYYYLDRKKDNLDFNLTFDQTNIAFTNAFLDPDVVKGIEGELVGVMNVSGTPDRPVLDGNLELNNASAHITMLGTSFKMNGDIYADRDGFYIDYMPIADEEGNTGSLNGTIIHSDYDNWNFDVAINLEDDAVNRDPLQPWRPVQLNKFLVMNTAYKEGELYYGKAYGTGNVNIFGYTDNLFINVDMTTKKGTWVNFPMYGAGEIEEGEDFITFVTDDSLALNLEPKIDFTGVDLDLNFKVTPDAKMKIIFNEQLGDEISTRGGGDIRIKMNNVGDLKMEGSYVVQNVGNEQGIYNFAMGPVKQPFYIADGGSITWTGDPYNATLNLSTYYKVNASLAELSPDQISSGNQEVQCYLNLTESLMKPSIGFEIKTPKASESGKDLIARINSEQDELNRQFFSLLLWKKFQPMRGSSRAGGGAALDLVANQINSVLSQVSEDYKLNVNLDADNITGDNSLELGLSKGFLDDRLVLTGSVGVENNNSATSGHSQLIGDVNLEYKLNKSGTFSVNVFNESNDYSVIQDKNLGPFTQGAGLHYQEDFDNAQDFKLIQYFLDIFRSKKNKRYPIKKKRKQTPVPKEKEAVIEED